MASQVLDILTVAARLANNSPEGIVDNVLVTSYPKTPRGKGALNEYFRMIQRDHPDLPVWAETARVWFEKTGRKPLITPPPAQAPQAVAPQAVAPQAVAPQAVAPQADCLLPDGGAILDGKYRHPSFIRWMLKNTQMYLELKKAAQ